jgi:L-Ala-D/L-Glu epimerase
MNVESLSCSRVEIALHETFRTAIRETDSISALRVVLHAGGKVGVGYATATPAITGDTVEGIEELIADVVGPYLVGRRLEQSRLGPNREQSRLGTSLEQSTPYVLGAQSSSLFGIPDAVYAQWTKQCSSGMAGVDLALHDVMFGSHNVVGGPATETATASVGGSVPSHSPASPDSGPILRSLVTSVTIGAGSLEDMVATAHRRVAAGFRVIKAKLGADPVRDAQRLIALAQALGAIRTTDHADGAHGAVQFWVDANQGWSVAQALDIFDAALDANVVLGVFEQPTPAADLEALRAVRMGVHQRCVARGVAVVPVVADESARTLADVDRIIEADAADAINVKFMKFGGLTGSGVAVAKARVAGLGVLVGSMMEHPHSVAAAVRFASSLNSLSALSFPAISFPALSLPAIAASSFSVHDLDAAWWAKDTSPLVYADGIVSVT